MRFLIFLLFIFLKYESCISQTGINSIWNFGFGCRLDFSSGSPVVSSSPMYALEGSASISDTSGNLLFFTNGVRVWRGDNTELTNNTNQLGGHNSSTQSALIAPWPENPGYYYIFTSASGQFSSGGGPNVITGINFSILNINANAGAGAIIELNTNLLNFACEKLCAIQKCNSEDIWVLAHGWESSDYYAWKLTSQGISSPTISSVGTYIPLSDSVFYNLSEGIGYLKASNNGKSIAAVHAARNPSIVELFDFNFNTGVLSNLIIDTLSTVFDEDPYGVCFSPDDSKLYVTSTNYDSYSSKLFQYNALANSSEEFHSSKIEIDSITPTYGGMEIGPDNKIYIAHGNTNFLSVIHSPNETGLNCAYAPDEVILTNCSCGFGLQNIAKEILNVEPPELFSMDSVHTCLNSIVLEFQNSGGVNYWSNGDTTQSINVNETGNYYLNSVNDCYDVTDSIYVGFNGDLEVEILVDTVFCNQENYQLKPEYYGEILDIVWYNGNTDSSITVTQTGLYSVYVYNQYCSDTASVNIEFIQIPEFDLGPDKIICPNDANQIGVDFTNLNFEWSTGATDSIMTITESGDYWLKISKSICRVSDSISVILFNNGKEFIIPNVFSPNGDSFNDFFVAGIDDLKDYSLNVYDRCGRLVFNTSNPINHWNGKLSKTDVPEGTYFYVCNYFDNCSNGLKIIKGSVLLLK